MLDIMALRQDRNCGVYRIEMKQRLVQRFVSWFIKVIEHESNIRTILALARFYERPPLATKGRKREKRQAHKGLQQASSRWLKTPSSQDACARNVLDPKFASFRTSGTLPLNLDLFSFGAVIFVVFLEPIMLQSLVCCDTLLWIIDKDLFEQIEELPVELVVGWDDFLESV
ncbi:hypothetical protein KCU81_g586, partial [Aureobasidium melanogenum]